MALAEATVRVTLDVAHFERELRDKVKQAANRAGRDFDKEMKDQLSASGRNASAAFRDSARTGMSRAGRDAATDFDRTLRQGLSQTGGRVAQRLGQGLRTGVSRAGTDAGRGFADNMTRVLTASGTSTANSYVQALSAGITRGAARTGATVGRNLQGPAVAGAATAGRAAGRQFNVSFGVGTTSAGRPIVAAFALIGSAIIESVGPSLSIIAALPGLLFAVTTAAVVTGTAFQGVGDAIKAFSKGDLDEIVSSMAKLSPAAQSFVREFVNIRPELSRLRSEIQDAFFAEMQGEVTDLAKAFTGPLRSGILDVSSSMGSLARGFAIAFSEARGVENLNKLFRSTSRFLDQLAPGLQTATRGMLDFVGATAPGLNTIGRAISNAMTRFGEFLTRASESGEALAWVEGGIIGLRSLVSSIGDIVRVFATLLAAARPLTFGLSLVFGLVANLVEAFSELPGPIQTAVLAAVLFTRSGLPDFLNRTMNSANPVVGVFRQMADAYRNTAGPLQTFIATNTMLNTTVGQTPSVFSRMRDSIANVGAVAAGAGAALARGLGSAVTGLVGALGGPWGLAIAGAGIALSLFASAQEEARKKAAQHAAEISKLSDTLNKQTGAVTAATFAMRSKEFAEKGLIKTAATLGVSADDFVAASLGQADALSRVTDRLRANAAETVRSSAFYQLYGDRLRDVGVSFADLTDVAIGNADATSRVARTILDNIKALGLTREELQTYFGNLQNATGANKQLADAIGLSNGDLNKAREILEQQTAAMTPAQLASQRFADALGVLADKTSDADTKARALTEALNILAGGTVSAEVAQGRFTELLATLDERLKEGAKGLVGYGDALVTNAGRINTSTTAGAFLVNTYEQLSSQLTATAASTLEAGRATGDLDGAYVKIAQQTQEARAQFIQTATAMGLSEVKASQLADAYGLIPAKVLTTVTDQGSALNVQNQIAGVYAQIRNLPPNTPVRVQGLTEDAQRQLRDVGIKVEAIPNSTDVTVTANTKQAVGALQGLVSRFSGTVINFVAGLFDGNAMGNIVPNAVGNIVRFAHGGKHLRNMPANRADIVGPNTWRVIGDRATHDEAYIPINSSARSRSLLNETAKRMGFTLLADGAVLGNSRSGGLSGGLNVAAGAIVINAPFADPRLVARATVNELAQQVGATG